jgi:hypothetical protein
MRHSQDSIELCSNRNRKTDIVIVPWRRLAVLLAQVILFGWQVQLASAEVATAVSRKEAAEALPAAQTCSSSSLA